MASQFSRRILMAAACGLAAAASGCTMHKQDTPSLTGPSVLGTAITINVTPSVLTQDGHSQSIVMINALDNNSQPLRNASLRADIAVNGLLTDFGSLSARSLVTDSSGNAVVVYTAPAAPGAPAPATDVQIEVTPSVTDFGNATPRFATIEVVPAGVIVPPPTSVTASFTVNPASPTDHQSVLFDGTASKSTTGTIVSWKWNFGDGNSSSGQTATHTFTAPGNYSVTLTVTDSIGASNSQTQNITVGQGANPTASFVTSPAAPVINQTINFNAAQSTAVAGRFISAYSWDFGDGTGASGVTTTHSYATAGVYTVVLQVTDDAGHVGTTTQSLTVTTGFPTAQITVTPPTAIHGSTFNFIGSQSTVAPGRLITSYKWDFGDGSSGSGPTTSHVYGVAGTYTVTLIVTDDQGQQGIATATVTVT